MKRNIILLSLLFNSLYSAFAQKLDGEKNIKELCGCFEVEFKYAETFADNNKYQDRERITQVKELVIPVEESDKKIVLQHLLLVNDSMIIKHWREDWEYESPVLLNYIGEHTWKKTNLVAEQFKNKWTQTVWEVSDAPRYQGVSDWVTTDNKRFWMNTTDAPLPRREYTKRSDYNILKRRNMIIVDRDGWIHEQDNQKIKRSNGSDSLIAEEKGINTYKRIADDLCGNAKIYWNKNAGYWSRVRKAWDNYLANYSIISVKPLVDGKPLYQYLIDMEEFYAGKKSDNKEIDRKIRASLDAFCTGK